MWDPMTDKRYLSSAAVCGGGAVAVAFRSDNCDLGYDYTSALIGADGSLNLNESILLDYDEETPEERALSDAKMPNAFIVAARTCAGDDVRYSLSGEQLSKTFIALADDMFSLDEYEEKGGAFSTALWLNESLDGADGWPGFTDEEAAALMLSLDRADESTAKEHDGRPIISGRGPAAREGALRFVAEMASRDERLAELLRENGLDEIGAKGHEEAGGGLSLGGDAPAVEDECR